MSKLDLINIGDNYSKKFEATDEIVREISRISGDINPIHLDEEYAKKSIFKKRIAHGLFCLNGISMIIGNHFPGEGSILINQIFNYKRPVYINDIIEVKIILKEKIEDKEILILEHVCLNQNGLIVMEGTSKVKWS